jgi:hypothetical protein
LLLPQLIRKADKRMSARGAPALNAHFVLASFRVTLSWIPGAVRRTIRNVSSFSELVF